MSKRCAAASDRRFLTSGTCSLAEQRRRVGALECKCTSEANPGWLKPFPHPLEQKAWNVCESLEIYSRDIFRSIRIGVEVDGCVGD